MLETIRKQLGERATLLDYKAQLRIESEELDNVNAPTPVSCSRAVLDKND